MRAVCGHHFAPFLQIRARKPAPCQRKHPAAKVFRRTHRRRLRASKRNGAAGHESCHLRPEHGTAEKTLRQRPVLRHRLPALRDGAPLPRPRKAQGHPPCQPFRGHPPPVRHLLPCTPCRQPLPRRHRPPHLAFPQDCRPDGSHRFPNAGRAIPCGGRNLPPQLQCPCP